MPINIIKLGEWPNGTEVGVAEPGKPGIAIVEDSPRDADNSARFLEVELGNRGVTDVNIYVILNLPGDDFMLARALLQKIRHELCMVLVDMADDDAVEWKKRKNAPTDPQDPEVFPGIPLAHELLAIENAPIVVGLTGFPQEKLSECGPLGFDLLYKPTFRRFIGRHIRELLGTGGLQRGND